MDVRYLLTPPRHPENPSQLESLYNSIWGHLSDPHLMTVRGENLRRHVNEKAVSKSGHGSDWSIWLSTEKFAECSQLSIWEANNGHCYRWSASWFTANICCSWIKWKMPPSKMSRQAKPRCQVVTRLFVCSKFTPLLVIFRFKSKFLPLQNIGSHFTYPLRQIFKSDNLRAFLTDYPVSMAL